MVATQYTVPTPSDLKDYEPLGLINMDEAVFAVFDSSPFRTLSVLVSHARGHPKELKLGTAPGTSAHIMGALFAKSANIEFLEVPFGGGGARSVALAGKHIDADIDVPAIYKPVMEAGKVRLLGIGAEKRSPLFPDVATFREQGIDLSNRHLERPFRAQRYAARNSRHLGTGVGKRVRGSPLHRIDAKNASRRALHEP